MVLYRQKYRFNTINRDFCYYFISKKRTGFGATFNTHHAAEWFHFAIPTPVIFGGKTSNLEKVFVLFKTQLGAKIIALHIYDGSKKILEFNQLNLTGDHGNALDAANAWKLNPVHINYGLGLSVNVDFGKELTPAGVPEITFTSAGADFTIP